MSVYKYDPSTMKAQFHANELFKISGDENNEGCFQIDLLDLQIEKQKYLIKGNYKLRTYISYQVSG